MWKIKLLKWFRKVKNTLIFNDMWNGICENDKLKDKEDGEARSNK